MLILRKPTLQACSFLHQEEWPLELMPLQVLEVTSYPMQRLSTWMLSILTTEHS